MVENNRAYQYHLGEKLPELVYRFDAGTVIYPLHSSRGALQGSVFAEKTDRKHWGLNIYVSKSSVELYFDGRTWIMHDGSQFTAYAQKAHKVKMT